jgi:hypothetical protein
VVDPVLVIVEALKVAKASAEPRNGAANAGEALDTSTANTVITPGRAQYRRSVLKIFMSNTILAKSALEGTRSSYQARPQFMVAIFGPSLQPFVFMEVVTFNDSGHVKFSDTKGGLRSATISVNIGQNIAFYQPSTCDYTTFPDLL